MLLVHPVFDIYFPKISESSFLCLNVGFPSSVSLLTSTWLLMSKSGLQQIAATNLQRDTENYLLYYIKVYMIFCHIFHFIRGNMYLLQNRYSSAKKRFYEFIKRFCDFMKYGFFGVF